MAVSEFDEIPELARRLGMPPPDTNVVAGYSCAIGAPRLDLSWFWALKRGQDARRAEEKQHGDQ